MRPDLADAFDLLKRAMAKTPGSETHSAGFVAAKDLIGQYQEPGNSSSSAQKGINWQMPGKGWSTRDDSTLPEPPMDRLIVRQAVGVPVSPTMLLVDSAAVNGADEVFVRIDGKTIIAGTVRKPLTSAKNAFAGVALVHVTGYAFTPLGRDQGADAAKDVDATVCGIGTYAEMGASFRTAKASVHPIGETFRVSASLIPGEAATPVMTESGQLVCFLTGRTDPTAENGGDEQVIPLSDIGTLIKSATPKGGAGIGMGHGLKRTGDPTPVKGQAFVVYGIFAEKFENK
jgi:hypothetical protein